MTVHNSDRFEERLLAELRQVVAARPAPATSHPPARRPRLRLALSGAGLAAAIAAVAITVTSGDRTPAAYAVQSRPDGSVSVEINSLKDADGLQRKLRAAGIPAIVSYTPSSELPPCPAPEAGVRQSTEDGGPSTVTRGTPPKDGSAPRMSGGVRVDGDGHTTFTIDPGHIEPGEHVVITTSDGTVSSIGMQITHATTANGAGGPGCLPKPPKQPLGG